jgi:hypothetical protein
MSPRSIALLAVLSGCASSGASVNRQTGKPDLSCSGQATSGPAVIGGFGAAALVLGSAMELAATRVSDADVRGSMRLVGLPVGAIGFSVELASLIDFAADLRSGNRVDVVVNSGCLAAP